MVCTLAVADAVRVGNGFTAGRLDFVGYVLCRAGITCVTTSNAAAQIVDHDLCACTCRQYGAFLADATGSACNQNHFSVKNTHLRFLPYVF